MPQKRSKSRVIIMLAVAAMSIGVMSPALANQHGEVPPVQTERPEVVGEALGAENAAVGQAIAAARVEFATVTVQDAITAFLAEVDRFTTCMADTASLNEEGAAEGGATLAYDECGPLDATLSPGHLVSALNIE